jgi:FKBP-type peptidyl-prolyl cis-trans isomerase 2
VDAGRGDRIVRVKEVQQSTAIVDLNHPQTGKTLHFEVRVLHVAPAK